QTQNDFSRGSMARNILQMALPMTVAQLINILYNVVDRMYLGKLPGHLSLTGLGLCLPIISILMGFANLCGMGGAPLCSIHRGKGEDGEAERILGNSFALLLLFGAGLTALGLAFRRPILYLFGASDLTFPYAKEYRPSICWYGLRDDRFGDESFINAQGFGRIGMGTAALGALVNIVLDPIFIFVSRWAWGCWLRYSPRPARRFGCCSF
ncbi:MAG: MATE family efflux transporter, partial [Flavonifractor plautii]